MHASELTFFTTQELIDELLRRKTFLGVVVHSEQDYKQEEWGDERTFKAQFNGNLNATEASRLLDSVASYINLNLS